MNTVNAYRETIAAIKNFITSAEQTLADQVECMCKNLDPGFSNWTLFITNKEIEGNTLIIYIARIFKMQQLRLIYVH